MRNADVLFYQPQFLSRNVLCEMPEGEGNSNGGNDDDPDSDRPVPEKDEIKK